MCTSASCNAGHTHVTTTDREKPVEQTITHAQCSLRIPSDGRLKNGLQNINRLSTGFPTPCNKTPKSDDLSATSQHYKNPLLMSGTLKCVRTKSDMEV